MPLARSRCSLSGRGSLTMPKIAAIGHFVPPGGVDALELGRSLGVDEEFIRQKLGTARLPRIGEEMDTADLATAACRDALERWGGAAEGLRALIVCTQSPHGEGLPHTAATVQHALGLGTSIAAFDISLGCSGYVYGLAVIDSLLSRIGSGYGVLVTADPYSWMLDERDRDTALLFGDAATATVVGPEGQLTIGRAILETDGGGGDALRRSGGLFHMAGRQVFNFAATRVPRQVESLLAAERLQASDIDAFVLHQGSRYIVETIASRLRADPSRVPVEISSTGNTVSSSIPLILRSMVHDESKRRIVLSGFGVGLSWGSMLLLREPVSAS